MRFRKRDESRKNDVSLLCLLADIATLTNKALINKVAEDILSLLNYADSKRIASLIFIITENRKQKEKSRKSDLKLAQHYVTWAKNNHATGTKLRQRSGQ